jgi:hypothetical protein
MRGRQEETRKVYQPAGPWAASLPLRRELAHPSNPRGTKAPDEELRRWATTRRERATPTTTMATTTRWIRISMLEAESLG